jgi:hypothetical protein
VALVTAVWGRGGTVGHRPYRRRVPEETTEKEQPRTILQRMLDAKISEDRALHYLRNDWVRSDGQVITDVDTVVEKFVLSSPPVTENVNDHPGEPA